MDKKKYMRPETCLYAIEEKLAILAGSVLEDTPDSDYNDENMEEYWDSDKRLWGD